MSRPAHPQWLLALGSWTVFVWFQRIGNVLSDEDLEGVAQIWRLVVAVGFVAAGVIVVAGVATGRRGGELARWVSPAGVGLAVVGSVWWVLRSGQILIGDWDGAFKAVHTVLAVVVVGLSVMVWRTRGYDRRPYG